MHLETFTFEGDVRCFGSFIRFAAYNLYFERRIDFYALG